MTNKAEMRRDMRLSLARLYPQGERGHALREEHSRALCAALRQHPAWRAARVVCAFFPLGAEPLIAPLWEEEHDAAFCFPRPHGQELQLLRIGARDVLRRADWKMCLPELNLAPVISPGDVDLLLVPGLAFAANGARLGRGGGYYDRLLAQKPSAGFAMAVCFSAQLVPGVPREEHDLPVDAIATEMGVIEVERPPRL